MPETSRDAQTDQELIERVERCLIDLRRGRMLILVDDEDRENEGDLCVNIAEVH